MGNLSETIAVVRPEEVNQEEWLCGLSDADLLDAWTRDQFRPALAELIKRYSVMVLSVCRRGCAREVDVDDAFQTTFLYLARNGGSIRHAERLPGWLQRVAQRSTVATWKKNRLPCEPIGDPSAVVEDPLVQLTHRHEAVVLDEELSDLPAKYRAVIVMHHYEATSIPDLATHFGTTVGTIRGRLQRGRKMLATRLRQRGLMPAIAFASVTAGSVQNVDAAEAVSRLPIMIEGGDLPDSPIESSLLSDGISKMVFLSKSMLVAGALTLSLFIVSGDGGDRGEGHQATPIDVENRPRTIQLLPQALAQDSGGSGVVVEIGSGVSPQDPARMGPNGVNQTMGQKGGGEKGRQGMPDMGMGRMDGGEKSIGFQGTRKNALLDAWKLDSKTAENVRKALDTSYTFDIDVPLSGLNRALADLTGQPVFLNERAVRQAKQELDIPIKYTREKTPLRSAMRQILRPLCLKASIDNDGIVITVDHAALAKAGIGTDAWINVDQEMERDLSAKLEQKGVFEFRDTPLKECISSLADQFDLKMVIREDALEDIGLTSNHLITLTIADITLQDALSEMLFALDCTYTVSGGLVVITSAGIGEEDFLTRVYWLDGTGLMGKQAIEIITATVSPDMWQHLGGPSTISGLLNPRAGLVIATTYTLHKKIERMLKTLRDSQFAPDPNLDLVETFGPGSSVGTGSVGF